MENYAPLMLNSRVYSMNIYIPTPWTELTWNKVLLSLNAHNHGVPRKVSIVMPIHILISMPLLVNLPTFFEPDSPCTGLSSG